METDLSFSPVSLLASSESSQRGLGTGRVVPCTGSMQQVGVGKEENETRREDMG